MATRWHYPVWVSLSFGVEHEFIIVVAGDGEGLAVVAGKLHSLYLYVCDTLIEDVVDL